MARQRARTPQRARYFLVHFQRPSRTSAPDVVQIDTCCDAMGRAFNREVHLVGDAPSRVNRYSRLSFSLRRGYRAGVAPVVCCPYCSDRLRMVNVADPTDTHAPYLPTIP